MEKQPLKVAIYTRVSTEEQAKEGFSLKAQEEHLRTYAKNMGYEVYDVYADEGYSGKDYNRPEIQRLFQDLYEEKFQGILVKSVDRISRKMSDISKLLDDVLFPNNCRLLVSDNNLDSSSVTGAMIINFLGSFAQYERAMIIDRVKAGMEKRAELGYWNGGRVLGYDTVNKELVVNEHEAMIVKKIFEMRAEGKGYKTIAQRLNEEGYRTKMGRLFSICTVKTILENEIYIGKCRWGRRRDWSLKRRKGTTNDYVLVDGRHTPIILPELWARVQAVNRTQKESVSKNRNFNGEFILSGILRCPACGAGTVMSKTKKRDGSGYHLYYMCQAYHTKGKKACSSNLIVKEHIENKVVQLIKELVQNEIIVENVLAKIEKQHQEEIAALHNSLILIGRSLEKKKSHLDKLSKDYFAEKISAETYNELSEALRKEIKELQEKKANIEREFEIKSSRGVITKEIVIEALRNFSALYDTASNEQKKALIRAIIKKIEVEPNRKDIKRITFWFDYDDALLLSKTRGTVS
ncbi:recombinase family protein [Anoxybacteroides rupiense]|uniref:recombinase family protein n=1 Tax=Anoxybacteroides rupiense TaxID=311460 RepID=UPI003FA524E1